MTTPRGEDEQRQIECPQCEGTGMETILVWIRDSREGQDERRVPCEMCGGAGEVDACMDCGEPSPHGPLCEACALGPATPAPAPLPTTLPGAVAHLMTQGFGI